MAVVKLRKDDKKILENLKTKIKAVKGETSGSEVLGLSLRFTYSKTDEFLATVIKNLETDSLMELIRSPTRGAKTDARRVEEYLYG